MRTGPGDCRRRAERRRPQPARFEPQIAQQVQHHRRRQLSRLAQRQLGQDASLLIELARYAGIDRVMAAVVRARSHLVHEQLAVRQHEELHAQHAHVVEPLGHRGGRRARLQRQRRVDARRHDRRSQDAAPVLVLGSRKRDRAAVAAAAHEDGHLALDPQPLFQHARHPPQALPGPTHAVGPIDPDLALAVVSKARRLDHAGQQRRIDRGQIGRLGDDLVGRHGQAAVRARAGRAVGREALEAVSRNALELGGHGLAQAGQLR